MTANDPFHVAFGPFRLDRPNRRLHRGASVVPLRPKAFAVLEQLVLRPGRLVSKEELFASVWPDTSVTDTVLKVCVREIREALDDDPDAPRFIETAHRLGYRFVGQASHTNLPAPVSTLVGRERDIAELPGILEQARLLTLTGAGGSGKSRLALEVAGAIGERFADGAWWVDLAPLDDDAFLPQAFAIALGVRDQPGQRVTPLLSRFLSTRTVLLVVDNCEHLIEPAAELIATLLRAAPALRVLATSREPLRVEGERVWVVPALACPERGDLAVDEALRYDAVRLFDERARAAAPDFTLTLANVGAVVETCRRLDGMPLAIELVAARVAALPVGEIANRLEHALGMLAPGRRAAVPRHQTLRAAIDWSYRLLTAEEQRLLCRLAVFADSFTLEAAESVGSTAQDPGDVVDLTTRLLDKSLLFVAERTEGVPWRYRLLETVRQYAAEKLVEHGDAESVTRRHLEYYLRVADAIEPRINSQERQPVLARLEAEHANVRAAIDRAWRAGEGNAASRLSSALFWFWFHRGHWREGRTFLGAALDHETAATSCRARLLLGDGVLAWAEGDQTAARERLETSAAVGRALGDTATTAHALHFLAMVCLADGQAAEGRAFAEDAVAIARTGADDFCLTIALASYGVLLLVSNDYDAARAALEESAERGRRSRDAWASALPLRNLAIIACRRGEYAAARALLVESLVGLRPLGEKWFLSRSIETLAEVLSRQGEPEPAAQLLGAAEALRDAVGAAVLAFYRADHDDAIAAVREELGAARFEACWDAGRAMTPDEAVAFAIRART